MGVAPILASWRAGAAVSAGNGPDDWWPCAPPLHLHSLSAPLQTPGTNDGSADHYDVTFRPGRTPKAGCGTPWWTSKPARSPHSEIQQYLSLHSASTWAGLPIHIVHRPLIGEVGVWTCSRREAKFDCRRRPDMRHLLLGRVHWGMYRLSAHSRGTRSMSC